MFVPLRSISLHRMACRSDWSSYHLLLLIEQRHSTIDRHRLISFERSTVCWFSCGRNIHEYQITRRSHENSSELDPSLFPPARTNKAGNFFSIRSAMYVDLNNSLVRSWNNERERSIRLGERRRFVVHLSFDLHLPSMMMLISISQCSNPW